MVAAHLRGKRDDRSIKVRADGGLRCGESVKRVSASICALVSMTKHMPNESVRPLDGRKHEAD